MQGYDLLGRLSAGAMGEVFLARQRGPDQNQDRGFERLVAVKRLLVVDDEHARRLLDEARTCARIVHPNVVGVIEVAEDRAGPFLVMDYVHGGTLALLAESARATKRPLPIRSCVRAAWDVANGLHAAHAQGIVHRDVKPSNIIVGLDGRARVVDFGIAVAHDDDAARLAPRTKTGGVRGTVPYMSPEQVAGRDLDARTDQFSLGVVLWELLAGRTLFTDANDVATAARVLTCVVPPLRAQRTDVPAHLDDVITRMLARDSARRFANVDDVARALDQAVPMAGADAELARSLEEHAGEAIRRRHARLVARTALDLVDRAAPPAGAPADRTLNDDEPLALSTPDATLSSATGPATSSSSGRPRPRWLPATQTTGTRADAVSEASSPPQHASPSSRSRSRAHKWRKRALSIASMGAVVFGVLTASSGLSARDRSVILITAEM